MIAIKKETNGTFTIEGMTEADLLTLYMISQTCFWQKKATPEVSEEAFNLSVLLEDFYKTQRGKKIKYSP